MISAAMFSGGKESVYAIYKARENKIYPKYLIHNHFEFPRPSPHSINIKFVREEAKTIGISLVETYLRRGRELQGLRRTLARLKINLLISGDVYLLDHMNWLKSLCAPLGIKCVFPLWKGQKKLSSKVFVEELSSGIEAVVCGVNLKKMRQKWINKILNKDNFQDFLDYCVQNNIDPCGELGEYHTLVLNSPLHQRKIKILESKIYRKNDFSYLKISKFKV